MTPPPMIALMVCIVACIIALIISVLFVLLDHFEKKHCSHFCRTCKYKNICDYYQNKK